MKVKIIKTCFKPKNPAKSRVLNDISTKD